MVRTPPADLDPNAPIYLGNPLGISAFADQQTDAANTYLLRLGDAVAGLAPPVITPEFPSGGSAPAVSIPEAPTITQPVWTSPAIPSEFTGELEIDDLSVEPFDVSPPDIVYGTAPPAFDGTLEDAPEVTLDFEDPTLTVDLPAAPDLLALNIVPFDGLTMPTFSADEPTLTLVEPSIREYTPGAQYTSALLTALQASLLERITTGGTGLSADAEQAIWDRGREREARAYADAVKELDKMERLGFALPPGVFFAKRTEMLREKEANDRGHSREVMIKAAELELDNVKHALTTATTVESQLINYANSVEQRLFDATKYATEAGIAIFNAKVQQYQALVEVYRTKVQIYEAQVRAEIAKVDAYRATVEAERAKAEVNRVLVDQYRAQIDAALSNIEIFKAEIAGIQAKAEIERTKVMIYGEQVRAFATRVNAYTAGIEGYRAQLEGEKTKAQVYQSQVEAFSSTVSATARQIEARATAFKSRVDAKMVEWDGYKAQTQGEASRVQSLASISNAVADIYRAEVTGIASYNEVLTKQWQATLDQNQQVARIGIETAKANSELYVTTRSLAIDAAKVGATVSAQLGAAAINAINWSSSISSSQSFGQSLGWSFSDSTSDSTSYNENYNYSV